MQLANSRKQWKRLIAAGGVGGGAMTAAFAWALSTRGVLPDILAGGVLGSLLFITLGFVVYKLISADRHRFGIKEYMAHMGDDLCAMTNVRPLIDGDLLLQYGGWAMGAHLAYSLVKIIREERPEVIVECGSGSSTALLASELQKLGEGRRVIALEHDPQYAGETRKILARHDLEDCAEVLSAPLDSWQLEEDEFTWYGFDLGDLPGEKSIDLLFVDGPPHNSGPMARYPAVPILRSYLSDDCIIVLDDSHRREEQEAARRWAEELGATLKNTGGRGGTTVIRRVRDL